jgi:group I intron endonuclease
MKKPLICGIYCIKNLVNGKVYIGQTTNFDVRKRTHKSSFKRGLNSIHIQSSFYKHGEKNFEVFMIEECTKEELNEREIYYIKLYKSKDRNLGYNLTEGGDTPPSFSGRKHSPETLEKMSNSAKGNQRWLGKRHSKETKEKMSEKAQGRILSESTRDKISKSAKGRVSSFFGKKHSPESIIKMSNSQKGKKLSEETKKKISESGLGRVLTKESILIKISSYRKKKRVDATSIYFGVSLNKKNGNWVAKTQIDKKLIFIAEGINEVEVAKKYDKWVKKNNLAGEFPLNFPKDYR